MIAIVTMLIDHVGATVVESQFFVTPSDGIYYLYFAMRIIGRVAFPIYCFLLAEGAHYTHDPRRYALRLFVGALLSEPGFDFALFGGWTWEHQNVMVTLLLGFGMVALMKKCVGDEVKIKAAGGIRTLDTALRMIELGVSRIGSTASVSIVEELKHRL